MSWSAIMICAPACGIHTPSIFPRLPAAPTESATASIEAAEAGASIIRLHPRDPETGKQNARPRNVQSVSTGREAIRGRRNQFSTGGGLGMSIDERLPGATSTSPENALAATCLTTLRMTAWRSGLS